MVFQATPLMNTTIAKCLSGALLIVSIALLFRCNNSPKNAAELPQHIRHKAPDAFKNTAPNHGQAVSVSTKSFLKICDCGGSYPRFDFFGKHVLAFGAKEIQHYSLPEYSLKGKYSPSQDIVPSVDCVVHQSSMQLACSGPSGVHFAEMLRGSISPTAHVRSKGSSYTQFAGYSSNGKHYVGITEDGEVHVYDTAARTRLRQFRVGLKETSASANGDVNYYLPSETELLGIRCTNNAFSGLIAWSIATGRPIRVSIRDEGVKRALCSGNIKSTENAIVSLTPDGKLGIMEVDSGLKQIRMKHLLYLGINNVKDMHYALSSDASWLITYEEKTSNISIWDVSTKKVISTTRSHYPIGWVSIGPSGKYAVLQATGVLDGCPSVGIVRTELLRKASTIYPFHERIVSFEYGSRLNEIVTLSEFGMVEKRDTAAVNKVTIHRNAGSCANGSISRLDGGGYALVCNPADDAEAFTRRGSPSIRIFDGELRLRKRLGFEVGFFYSMSVQSGGRTFVASTKIMDASYVIVDLSQQRILPNIIEDVGAHVSVDALGKRLVGYDGRALRVINTESGRVVALVPAFGVSLFAIDFSGTRVSMLEKSGRLSILDFTTQKRVIKEIGMIGGNDVYQKISFDKPGKTLAVVGQVEVIVYSIASRRQIIRRLFTSQCGIREARFSPDGNELGVLCRNGEISRYKL